MAGGGGSAGQPPKLGGVPEDLDFPGIMRLLTSKHTNVPELVDRHVSAVMKVCKQCRQGFLLKHIEPLIELVRLVVQRYSEGVVEFGPAICEMAKVASVPFVSCKASDMITYGNHLPAFVTAVVQVLSYATPVEPGSPLEEEAVLRERIRIEVANMLACWSRFGLDEDGMELRPDQPLIQAVSDRGTPNLRILRNSQATDELSAAFRIENSPEAIVIMLGAIRDMSLYKPLARQITNCGLLSNLIHVIRVNLLGSDVLLVAAEILWNVLELDYEGAAEALGGADVAESFRDFMSAVLAKGYRFKDKIFRNDMMVLLMYISKRPENRPFFASTGLLALLLRHAVTDHYREQIDREGVYEALPGVGAATSGNPGQEGLEAAEAGFGRATRKPHQAVPLTNSQEDMEFRVLLWSTLARCCQDEECAKQGTVMHFVPSLLSYLDVTETVSAEQRQWSREQRKKMQLDALSGLFSLVQCMPDAFMEGNGNAIVLRLIQTTQDRDLQRKCLNLLQVAVRMGPRFVDELGELGCVGALIELFKERDCSMGIRQLCASVVAGLCKDCHPANCREFRKRGGVEAVRAEVVYRPDETTENHLFYTLCVVDCIWSAVVGTRKNESRYLDAGGLFALLDVLEVAPTLLKRQIIGCLADFVENRKAAKLFVQWNSQQTMKGALKILLELWAGEQKARHADPPDGVLRDLDRPLNPAPALSDDPYTGGMFDEGAAEDDLSEGRTPSPPPLRADGLVAGSPLMSSKTMGRLRSTAKFDELLGKSNTLSQGFMKGATGGAGGGAGGGQVATAAARLAASAEEGDARAKIYAILSKVGFEAHDALSIEERQHMELLKLYPDCRTLETWIEVRENLIAKGIRPIRADLQWIEDSIAEQKTRTVWIQTIQQQLADERHAEDVASLSRFYDDIRSRGSLKQLGDLRSASRLSGGSDRSGGRGGQRGVLDDAGSAGVVKGSQLEAETMAMHGVETEGGFMGSDPAGVQGFSGVVSHGQGL